MIYYEIIFNRKYIYTDTYLFIYLFNKILLLYLKGSISLIYYKKI